MGVESSFLLMPSSTCRRIDPPLVCQFIVELRRGGWLSDPAAPNFLVQSAPPQFRKNGREGFIGAMREQTFIGELAELEEMLNDNREQDICLIWHVHNLQSSGLRYPLTAAIVPEAYYDIEIRLGETLLQEFSEAEIVFEEPLFCDCGASIQELPYLRRREIFHHTRYPAVCLTCGAPTEITVLGNAPNPRTGEPRPMRGGALYRSALAIDCGKMYPESGVTVDPELRSLFERFFGPDSRELQTVH